MYFEDLLANNNNEYSYSSLGLESPSLVSDAASLAGKRYESIERDGGLAMVKSSSKRLSFKKRKAKGVLVDDALEDTASSPVNSPKVRIFFISFPFLYISHSLDFKVNFIR